MGFFHTSEVRKLTLSAHFLIVACEFVHYPVQHLSRNGYPRGIVSYNMNDAVNKHRNKPKDIITVLPKKGFIVLRYLVSKKTVKKNVVPLHTDKNDFTNISSWRFDIKALKSDVQWNPRFFRTCRFGFNTYFEFCRFTTKRRAWFS